MRPRRCVVIGHSAIINEYRGEKFCGRFRSINAHAEQVRFKLSRIGDSASFQNSSDCCYSQWRSANKRGSHSVCQGTGVVRDTEVPRRYTGSALAWRTLRRIRTRTSGQLPHRVKDGRMIRCNTENSRADFCPRVVEPAPLARLQIHLQHRYRRMWMTNNSSRQLKRVDQCLSRLE